MKLFTSKVKNRSASESTLPTEEGVKESDKAIQDTTQPQDPFLTLAMPKPRHPIALTRGLSNAYGQHDKILVEQDRPGSQPFNDTVMNTASIACRTDSSGTFISALQSPDMGGIEAHDDTSSHTLSQQAPTDQGDNIESEREDDNLSFDLESLCRQIRMIQSQYAIDRAKWEKREQAHRMLEMQIMDELNLAHDRLLTAFAQRRTPMEESFDHTRYRPRQRSRSVGMYGYQHNDDNMRDERFRRWPDLNQANNDSHWRSRDSWLRSASSRPGDLHPDFDSPGQRTQHHFRNRRPKSWYETQEYERRYPRRYPDYEERRRQRFTPGHGTRSHPSYNPYYYEYPY